MPLAEVVNLASSTTQCLSYEFGGTITSLPLVLVTGADSSTFKINTHGGSFDTTQSSSTV